MRYEWDDEKAARNLRKHRVDFLDAIAAVEDPNRLEEIESQLDDGEERTRIIGLARGGVLFVAVTLRSANEEEICRIISARKATRNEEDKYYAGDREAW